MTPRSPPSFGEFALIGAAARRMTLNVPTRFTWITFTKDARLPGPTMVGLLPSVLSAPIYVGTDLGVLRSSDGGGCASGWYSGSVPVALFASDNLGGSGLASIRYTTAA